MWLWWWCSHFGVAQQLCDPGWHAVWCCGEDTHLSGIFSSGLTWEQLSAKWCSAPVHVPMAHWSYACSVLSRCKALALLISSRGAASHQLTLNIAGWTLRPLSSLPPWFASNTIIIIQVIVPMLLLTWISLWVLMFKLLNLSVFVPEMQKNKTSALLIHLCWLSAGA